MRRGVVASTHLMERCVRRAPGFIETHKTHCPRDRSVLLCTRWRHQAARRRAYAVLHVRTCGRYKFGRAFVRQARHLIGKLTCTSEMGLSASHAHRPAQDRGTRPLLACAPVSMVAGPPQSALRTFAGAVTAIAKTFKANDVSGHDLANLTSRGPRVTIGVFGPRREEDPRRPGHARAVTCGVRRVHCKCAHPGARAGAIACSAAHICVASRTVCCVVLCLRTLHFSVSAPPCVEAYGCVGAPVVHSLDASALPSTMRMTRAAVHPRARHTSRAGTRPADARGNEQPAARGRAQAPPLRVLGQVCCGQDMRMNMCARARAVCVSVEVGVTAGGPPGGLTRKSMPRHAPQHTRANVNSAKLDFNFSHTVSFVRPGVLCNSG